MKNKLFTYFITSLIVINLLQTVASAQHNTGDFSFSYADSATYAAYLQKDWDKVIEMGEIALQKGYTSYYLNMRLGIAYYSKAQYRKAILYFQSAWITDKSDVYLAEYLYYSYIFSGYTLKAEKFIAHIPPGMRQKMQISEAGGIQSVDVFVAYQFTDEPTNLEVNDLNGEVNIFGSQSVRKSYMETGLNANWISEKGTGTSLSYKYTSVSKTDRIQHNSPMILSTEGYVIQHFMHLSFDKNIGQNAYFMAGALFAAGGTSIIQTDSDYISNEWYTTASFGTAIYSDYALHAAYAYNQPYYNIYTDLAFGNVYNTKLLQAGFLFTLYPFANLNTSIYGGVLGYKTDDTYLVYKAGASQHIWKGLFLKMDTELGKHNKMLAFAGNYLYNSPDVPEFLGSANLTYYTSKLSFSVGALKTYTSGVYNVNTNTASTQTRTVKYWTSLINTSISWNF